METALDRFARSRGPALLSTVHLARQGKIQTIIGGSMLAVCGVAGIAPLLGAPAEVLFGTIGPALAGVINLGMGLGFFAAAKRRHSDVALTPEAASLLQALVMRAQVWQGGWRPRHAPVRGPHAWPGYRAPVEPSAEVLEALEHAAAAYNRVADALGDARDERSVRLRSAADAGIGEALHSAATQVEEPTAVERTATSLAELAGLVEASSSRPEAANALRSNLQATLDELRAEEEARRELLG